MDIVFGPLTLSCRKQNLLDYTETDPDGLMTVTETSACIDLLDKVDDNSFPVGLARPWSEVRNVNNCNNWGMMFDIATAGADIGTGSFVLQMVTPTAGTPFSFDATALGDQIAFTQPGQEPICGDAGSFTMPHTWRIKLYSYVDGADYYYVLEVYETNDTLLATASCLTQTNCSIAEGASFHVAYMPSDADPARDAQITISDVWVPGGSVLPQIRPHGTLGEKRILEGGRF